MSTLWLGPEPGLRWAQAQREDSPFFDLQGLAGPTADNGRTTVQNLGHGRAKDHSLNASGGSARRPTSRASSMVAGSGLGSASACRTAAAPHSSTAVRRLMPPS